VSVNVAASVKAKLNNLSKGVETGNKKLTNELLLVLYCQERLLYRLSMSKYRDNFILKGGLFLYSQTGFKTRPTRDADFLVNRIQNDENKMLQVFKDICNVEVEDDGINFDVNSITVETLKEDADYHGIRIGITAYLEKSRTKVQIDMGFNDAVVPQPQEIEYPVLIEDMPRPSIRAYTLESAVAEKFEAMISLSVINSRLKDFFDVYTLLSSRNFDGRVLWEAVNETFQKRGTDIKRNHEVFSEQFKYDANRLKQWGAFLNRTGLNEDLYFEEVMDSISKFLAPIYNSILDENEFFNEWDFQSKNWIKYPE